MDIPYGNGRVFSGVGCGYSLNVYYQNSSHYTQAPKNPKPAEENVIVCAGGLARHLDLKLPIHLPIEKSGTIMSVKK